MFYFAWVDKTDSIFSETEHAVEDEQVFALSIQHAEGDFPSLDIDVRNPRIGLLASTRKQWAWLSYRKTNGDVVPLFFGRLVGVPQEMQDEIVRLSFVARPADYEDQRATLAESLKVFPFWDPVFFTDEEQADPDSVLEGYSALWHIDRVTHVVSTSDILVGEDAQLDFPKADVFYDSVAVGYSESPARRAVVEATVQWGQTGSGSIDVTQQIIAAFEAETPTEIYSVGGEVRPHEGAINIVGGDSLIDNWPKFGSRIGGGWTVGASGASVIGDTPLSPTLTGSVAEYQAIKSWQIFHNAGHTISAPLRTIFDRSPGFIVEVQDETENWPYPELESAFAHGDINILWVPIWQIAASMKLQWEATRDRTEVMSFEMLADVQPLLTDADEEETIRLTIGPADVDDYIADVRSDKYFSTDRGLSSLEHLLVRARAHLLARARAVDISFEIPFEKGLDLSCRRSASIIDDRIPGGGAVGKVKAYELAADGGSGQLSCALTIGCSVGRAGSISASDGTPEYVEEGYVDAGYQTYTDKVTVLTTTAESSLGYTLNAYSANDDGANLFAIGRDYVTGLTVDGGLTRQQEAATAGSRASTSVEVVDKINGYETTVTLTMRPVTGGPFEATVAPTVTGLKVPRTIDLEESATE